VVVNATAPLCPAEPISVIEVTSSPAGLTMQWK
jgi:hypothetical protein